MYAINSLWAAATVVGTVVKNLNDRAAVAVVVLVLVIIVFVKAAASTRLYLLNTRIMSPLGIAVMLFIMPSKISTMLTTTHVLRRYRRATSFVVEAPLDLLTWWGVCGHVSLLLEL
jgi:uncharacterized integral membrane protein